MSKKRNEIPFFVSLVGLFDFHVHYTPSYKGRVAQDLNPKFPVK